MIKFPLKMLLVVLVARGVTSCLSPKESFIKKGAVLLSQEEVLETYRGNTAVGDGWVAYYREDGARIVDVPGYNTYHLDWNMTSTGIFCQTNTSGNRSCGPKIYKLGETYKVFARNKTYTFKVLPGNPRKLK